MARTHPEQTNAAIRALALELADDGSYALNATEIWRRLRDGDAGLPDPLPYIPKRTVQDKAAKIRREAKPQSDPLQDRTEVDASEAMLRSLLRHAHTAAQRIERRIADGRESGDDATAMLKWAKTIGEIGRYFAGLKAAGRPLRQPTKQDAATRAAQRTVSPASTLDELIEQERDADGPASDEPPPTGGDTDGGETTQASSTGEAQGEDETKTGGGRVSVENASTIDPTTAQARPQASSVGA